MCQNLIYLAISLFCSFQLLYHQIVVRFRTGIVHQRTPAFNMISFKTK